MNKENLINKVSKLLGVSSSEKEFAFQIFLEKTAEVIGENEALKYPDLGYFHFREEGKETGKEDVLVFIPENDEDGKSAKSLSLFFDIKRKNKNSNDFDPSVFSLSINKSTLPLEQNSPQNDDISYHMLKKTIEERVEELISSSFRIENYKMLDDIFTTGGAEDKPEVQSKKNRFGTTSIMSYEELIFNKMKLEDTAPEDAAMVTNAEKENDDEYVNVRKIFAKLNDDTDKKELDSAKPEKEKSFKEHLEELIPGGLNKDDFLNSGDDKKSFDWNWSDESADKKEEVYMSKLTNTHDDYSGEEAKDNNEKDEEGNDPFDELEKSLTDENEFSDIVSEISEGNESVPGLKKPKTNIIQDEYIQRLAENEDAPAEGMPKLTKSYEGNPKRLLSILLTLSVLIASGIYIFYFDGLGFFKNKQAEPSKEAAAAVMKDTLQKPIQTSPVKDSSLTALKSDSTKTNVSKEPVKTTVEKKDKLTAPETAEVKDAGGEKEAAPLIFLSGSKYFVQKSSWPNQAAAQQAVNKLKAQGESAVIIKAYIPQKKSTWFRVRVGGFNSLAEAQAYQKK